jgi:hypothetical protein
VAAEAWADQGTGRAVQARDSDWAVAEGREAREPVGVVALAPQVAGVAVALACGIRAGRVAAAAREPGQVRVPLVVGVGPAEAGQAVAVV